MPFLENLATSAGTAAGSNLVGTAISALTGGLKGRPQWRDINFMNDVANRLTPDEAGRHNTFQDLTFLEDTRRKNEGILSTAKALGMSPWELTGQSSGGTIDPTPSAGPGGPGMSGSRFMDNLVPIQVAKLQAQTQLQTAAMSNQTQKEIASMQTGGGQLPLAQVENVKAQTGLTVSQQALTAAQTVVAKAQEHQLWTQSAVMENRALLDTVQTIINTLPTTEVDLGILKSTHKEGYQHALSLMQQLDKLPKEDKLEDVLRNLPEQQFSHMMEDIIAVAGLITSAAKGAGSMAKGAMDAVYGTKTFLHGLRNK